MCLISTVWLPYLLYSPTCGNVCVNSGWGRGTEFKKTCKTCSDYLRALPNIIIFYWQLQIIRLAVEA